MRTLIPIEMIEKCRYFNNHQTASVFMIDDLVPTFVSYNEQLKPWNDWGYGRNSNDSVVRHLYKILDKFPEIRGTIFIPLESHKYLFNNSGMFIKSEDFNSDDIKFFNDLAQIFDFGFHGIKHTYSENSSINNPVRFEFSDVEFSDVELFVSKIEEFEQRVGIKFSGGKFPGYFRKNSDSFQILKRLNMKWWAYTLSDNNKSKNNCLNYIDNDPNLLVNVPTNVNGNIFMKYLSDISNKPYVLRKAKELIRNVKKEKYIEYLYNKQLPITIQEHFQNQSFNGKRQHPNLFDDSQSLEKMFYIMRGADIWHTTSSELAHYYDSYTKTKVIQRDNTFEISYTGLWPEMFVSFIINSPKITNTNTKQEFYGVLKNNKWVYNNLKQGKYIINEDKHI